MYSRISRTSICQDVASLVNKVAVFVVLNGGRSWALLRERIGNEPEGYPIIEPWRYHSCCTFHIRCFHVDDDIRSASTIAARWVRMGNGRNPETSQPVVEAGSEGDDVRGWVIERAYRRRSCARVIAADRVTVRRAIAATQSVTHWVTDS